jgi:hypothetical protein
MLLGAKPTGGSVPKSPSQFNQRTIYKELTVQWWVNGDWLDDYLVNSADQPESEPLLTFGQ